MAADFGGKMLNVAEKHKEYRILLTMLGQQSETAVSKEPEKTIATTSSAVSDLQNIQIKSFQMSTGRSVWWS